MVWIDKNENVFESVKDAAEYNCFSRDNCKDCPLYTTAGTCSRWWCSAEELKTALELVLIKEETMNDNVNHPAHYTQGGIECIDAIKASMTPAEYEGYLKGNIIKYLWRWRNKGGVESLRKGEWYLKKLIEENTDERMG